MARNHNLTSKELTVLKLICEGHSTKEVAVQLNISPRTVACHRFRILDKVGVRNSIGLLRWAVKHGLVEVELPDERAAIVRAATHSSS